MAARSRRDRRYVLDANALIGFFEDQAGIAKKVQDVFERALRDGVPVLMSAVTWGEVFYVEWRFRGEANAYRAEARACQLPLAVIPVDQDRATRAGALKQKHNLGYADSFAAELAIERSAFLLTADREFEKVGRDLALVLLPRR